MSGDTVNIRGKQYVTVAGRVALAHEAGGFWMPLPPKILTIGERTFVRVVIEMSTGGQRFYGTAEVKWNAPKGTADHDSPLECAETSALGRALGFAGFGSADGIASADEVKRNDGSIKLGTEVSSPRHRQPSSPATPSTIEDGRDPKGKPSPQTMQRIMRACATLGIEPPTAEQVPTQAEAEARLEFYTAEWKRQANLATVPVLPA